MILAALMVSIFGAAAFFLVGNVFDDRGDDLSARFAWTFALVCAGVAVVALVAELVVLGKVLIGAML